MFRSKKKGRKQVIRTLRKDGESSEEDDNPTSTIVVNRHKKRRGKGAVDRSVEGESTATAHSNTIEGTKVAKKRKKRKGTGMGFGGSIAGMVGDGDEERRIEEQEIPSRSLYDKEALQKLRAEQKMLPVHNVDRPSEPPAIESIANVEEQNFIALNKASTADKEGQGAPFSAPNRGSEFSSFSAEGEPDEESHEWQNHVAQRAGLASFCHNDTKAKSPPTPEEIKEQLKSTLSSLQNQHEDLGNAIMRRQADLQQAKADYIRYEETLKATGKAFEYYQKLRNDIANWVGALRDLQTKVAPVFDALLRLCLASFKTAEEELRRCPEDVYSLLHQLNAIDQVVGYQPNVPPLDLMAVTVDEFGRDVKSQFLRDRDKRYKVRLEHASSEPSDVVAGEQRLSYLWLEDTKPGGRREQYRYLQQALGVAIEDLDTDYTSLEKLIGVFDDWKQSYPEDFRQCYAVLSLGDLAGVLVQADFCRTSELFRMFGSDLKPSNDDSLSLLDIMQGMDDGIGLEKGDSGAIQRVLERNHIMLLLELLKESPSGCFISSTRSKALCQMFVACEKQIDENTETFARLQKAVHSSIQEALGRISIVILKKDFDATDSLGKIPKEQLDHALRFASCEQAKWIQHLLMNMLNHWLIALQKSPGYEAAMEVILQFLSQSYLLLLSSMDKEIASAVFAPVWTSLRKLHADFIDSPSFMIQSAPIRAAAMAYGLI